MTKVASTVLMHKLPRDFVQQLFINEKILSTAALDPGNANVFDDVVVELAMAVLQYFNSKPNEEHSFRCMKSLARFCQISRQDVPQLVQMIGPPPSAFKGISNRIDEQITEIQNYLR
eukprot:XP_008180957.1 PREDICTED: uncharacterized protein LOC103308749 [Acyrthosiphon pisum]